MRTSLVILVLFVFARALAAASFVTRQIPAQALPGIPFPVTNLVTVASSVAVQAFEDELPAGWTATTVSHSGRFDTVTKKVKWGPFFDATPRALSYVVTAPAGASGSYTFHGQASFDAVGIPFDGVSSIQALGPAEANRAVTTLPDTYSPGIAISYRLNVTPAANNGGYAVEDSLPAGWTANDFNEGGAAVGGKLKWGPFFDANARELRCTLLPIDSGAVIFSGIASFDGFEAPIGGVRQIFPNASRIERSLPEFFDANQSFADQISVRPAPGVQVYSVVETIPAGWTANSISDGGVFDVATHSVKWGPLFDENERALTCSIMPPVSATQPAQFSGEGSFDTTAIGTTGPVAVLPRTGSAVRKLPAHTGVLTSFQSIINVAPRPGSGSWALQEGIPAGCSVSNISEGGVFDSGARLVKWGPFFDDAPRAFICTVVSGAIPGSIHFAGVVSFDSVGAAISGESDVFVDPAPSPENSLVRQLPDIARPGSLFMVTNQVAPAAIISVYAVEEQIPAGWAASEISDGGAFDVQNRLVKWGPYFDATPRVLTYRVVSPESADGSNAFYGHGSFDGANVETGGETSVTLVGVPNRPPVAVNDTFTRLTDQPLLLAVSKILANDSDPDGDALTLSIPAVSARGISIFLANGVVTYAPGVGFNQDDSFVYTVRDPDGASASATVAIQLPPAGTTQNVTSLTPTAGGALVKFAGIPGFTYDVQLATTLTPPNWSTVARRIAASSGSFEYFDPGGSESTGRYFRTVYVP